ncbi:MAG: bifunctional enoyl-CoA hydratase/phosphate acetyltransferase [Pseudomonadota bacterium]
MLSKNPIEAPKALLQRASGQAPAPALVVGADTPMAMESARAAAEAGFIQPVLIGDLPRMAEAASEIGWDITKLRQIQGAGDAELADAAAKAVADPEVQIVMKGQIHTDALMGAMLRRDAGVRIGRRLSHVFHMTVPGSDKPLLITDGALNVAPDEKTRQAILENVVALCPAIGIDRPKIALLSATEEPMASMPSSEDAAALRDWAHAQGFPAEIDGPLAFDNAVSPEAVRIKGMTGRPVAGQADVLVVPAIETGNALFKMMVWFQSACAAGVVLGGRVPIIITSRADPPEARLASAALATLAARI